MNLYQVTCNAPIREYGNHVLLIAANNEVHARHLATNSVKGFLSQEPYANPYAAVQYEYIIEKIKEN